MCGIVGALAFKKASSDIDPRLIEQMRDTMVHRGPDGCGIWISPDRRVGLGHRRLAIIDLSEKALQPMSNEDDSVLITFNGEIYNHADLRRELEAIGGHTWKTDHSDTEVIIHGYEQWGIDVVHRLRGMFAFALWDAKKRVLWLVRDRLGIKPLYYSVHNGRIAFASEIKALLKDPQQKRAVNEEAFFHYLTFLAAPAPNTLFEGIGKVPCGCLLRVTENGDVEERRYWDVWDHTEPLVNASEDEITERLLEELRTAVSLRKISDVPVGAFLSGGIDSSTNAQLFGEGDGKVKTFTIGYEGTYDTYQNELHYARIAAEHAKTDHHELLLKMEDLMEFLPTMVHLQDEPIADPVCFPLYAVSKLARDNGVIVCQVGEGADELFCGYRRWGVLVKLAELNDLPVPRFMRKAFLGAMDLMGKSQSAPREWVRRSAEGLPIFWSGTEAYSELQKQKLLSPRLRKEFAGRSSWEAVEPTWRRYQEKAWEKSHKNWMAYADMNLRLPELLLMKVDKMSMGVSLEARVPFLDHKFVEFAMSVPSAFKTKNGQLKYPLKKAVRGLIPDALIDRKKQGFGVPVYEWLFDRLGDKARKEMEFLCDSTDLFDRDAVMAALASPEKGPSQWVLLNVAMWWRHNLSGESEPV